MPSDKPLVIKASLDVATEITVNDPRVLELDRGVAFVGEPFRNVLDLAKHLAVNLGMGDHTLSQLDGWADLPDTAVTVREVGVEPEWVHIERGA
jgi:hypothetical protein